MPTEQKAKSLYFIAIVPEEPLLSRINTMKAEVAVRYKIKASLKSPAHITLFPPFIWEKDKEGELINAIETISQQQKPFDINLENFDSFIPKVIFIKPLISNEIKQLFKNLHHGLKESVGLVNHYFEHTKFHPHMTIMHRDFGPIIFKKAWKVFQEEKFEECFTASKITLLKHNGLNWDVYREFSLEL